jgi:ectoine hydroxylase
MLLSESQLSTYDHEGYLFLPDVFAPQELELMGEELSLLLGMDTPDRVLENGSATVRALHGCHQRSDLFGRLIRDPRLLVPARQVLGAPVYVHQFKINVKAAFHGDLWPWHQDFIFWLKEDGMPAPRVTNVVLFLDDVTEFNGPTYLIPRSHKQGVIDVSPRQPDGSWLANVSASLKYSIDSEVVRALVRENGIIAPKGGRGSLLFFDCNLIHGSPANISPFDRRLILVSYNATDNLPRPRDEPRPDFLVSRNYSPLEPLEHADLCWRG